jgi:hypothetical protein
MIDDTGFGTAIKPGIWMKTNKGRANACLVVTSRALHINGFKGCYPGKTCDALIVIRFFLLVRLGESSGELVSVMI